MIKKFMEYMKRVNREGKDELINHLKDIGYFKAPASTRFHLAIESGLLEHSLNVTDKAIEIYKIFSKELIYKTLGLDLNEVLSEDDIERYNSLDQELIESVILISLLHDIGKAGYYGEEYYKPNILKNGSLGKTPYESNKNLSGIPHEISAIHIISKFMELTQEETYAILHHNGMYSNLKYDLKDKERPLQLILHFADMWASKVIEVEELDYRGSLF